MSRCHHKLLSSAAAAVDPIRLRPARCSNARLLTDDLGGSSAPILLPVPTICPIAAVLAPMADAEDGELPFLGSWALGDPREDMGS